MLGAKKRKFKFWKELFLQFLCKLSNNVPILRVIVINVLVLNVLMLDRILG